MKDTILRIVPSVLGVAALLSTAASAMAAADLVRAKDGSGVYGYKDTPKLPWCDWLVHDCDRPAPRASTRQGRSAPASRLDAIVLFDGKDLAAWQPSDWKLVDGCLRCPETQCSRRRGSSAYQLHLEWMAPNPPAASGTTAATTASC